LRGKKLVANITRQVSLDGSGQTLNVSD